MYKRQEAQSAAASVGAVSGTSAADQLNAAAGTVSVAAGTGDALQGDAGTISAGPVSYTHLIFTRQEIKI